MQFFQRDDTFGVYDVATDVPGRRSGRSGSPGISRLRPVRKVVVPVVVPLGLGTTEPARQLKALSAAVPPEFHLPDIPGLPPMPSVSIQKGGNLWMVDPAAQPALKQMLGMASFSVGQAPPPQDPNGYIGSLSFSAAQIFGDGASRVDSYIQNGYAAMASVASLSTGTINLLFTKKPDLIASLAGGDSPVYVLLSDQPAGVVNAASKIAGAQPTPTQPVPSPPGQGGTVVPPGPQTQPAATPGWLMPLAVGAVVLGGAALLLTAAKR